jgi:hypothetical protein
VTFVLFASVSMYSYIVERIIHKEIQHSYNNNITNKINPATRKKNFLQQRNALLELFARLKLTKQKKRTQTGWDYSLGKLQL